MNLLERVLTLLRANLNSVVEKADDPEKVLRQLQLDMRNQLVQVKTQVATAIAEGHQLQKRSQEKKLEEDVWLKKLKLALQQNNDETARTALMHYNEIHKQTLRYQQQQKEQEQLVVNLRSALRQLEAKISEVETTIDLLKNNRHNALIQQRVYDELNKAESLKEKERTERARDAIQEAAARARALAELRQRDLETQLDQLSSEQLAEQQLLKLKQKAQAARERPLLHEGSPHPSPLLRPRPQKSEPARKDQPSQSSQPATPLPAQSQPAAERPDTTEKDLTERLKKLLDTL
ncbi:MAG: PspA/IM30 family protein [Ktedonobacteraceae bacterium]|nr:PspA/IM30 family protein [Ktedonobacteraceae bacterium]